MTAAEDEARTRAAAQMELSTHSLQVPDFYRRLGFEPVGHIENYPVGYQNIFFWKQLQGHARVVIVRARSRISGVRSQVEGHI